jgi:hypothetical protein
MLKSFAWPRLSKASCRLGNGKQSVLVTAFDLRKSTHDLNFLPSVGFSGLIAFLGTNTTGELQGLLDGSTIPSFSTSICTICSSFLDKRYALYFDGRADPVSIFGAGMYVSCHATTSLSYST